MIDPRSKTGFCRPCFREDADAKIRQGGYKLADIPAELLDEYRFLTRKKSFTANEARLQLGLPPLEEVDWPVLSKAA
jgi:hypothetical protein